MGMIINLLFWVIGIIAILAVLGFILPDRQQVSRSITVSAPIEKVFPHIGDFHQWSAWSPWAERDPDMKMEIEGEGLGQTMRWSSERKQVGSGSQTVIEYDAPFKMVSMLDFGQMGQAKAAFDLKKTDTGATEVTWSMDTHMREGTPFMMKPMATYMGFMMDKWVGQDYETGLAKLKATVEGN